MTPARDPKHSFFWGPRCLVAGLFGVWLWGGWVMYRHMYMAYVYHLAICVLTMPLQSQGFKPPESISLAILCSWKQYWKQSGNNSGYSVIWWYLGVPGGTLVVSGGSLRVPLGHPGLGAGGPTLRCRNHCNLQGLRSRYDVSPRRNAPEVQKVP